MKKCMLITDICKLSNIFRLKNFQVFREYSKLIYDIGLIDLMNVNSLNNMEKASMIAYYLGSNTLNVKKEYFNFLNKNKIKNILYFFDLSFFKFEKLEEIKKEFDFIKDASYSVNINIYIPTKMMSNSELFSLFNILIMLDLKSISIGNVYNEVNYDIENEFLKLRNYDLNISVIADSIAEDKNINCLKDKRVKELILKL